MKNVKAKTNKTYIQKIQETIDAIDTAREHCLDVARKDPDLNEVSDEKWQHIVKGKFTASESAMTMLQFIKKLEDELQELKNPKQKETETKEIETNNFLAQHLEE